MKKICVIGLGYIGLPIAAVLADNGFEVLGVDVNESTVITINECKVHIYEPDLDIKVKNAVTNGSLKASLKPSVADVYVIAVPTPLLDNNKPDVSYIKEATKSIAPFVQPGNIIILESTSPVGTTERMVEWLQEEKSKININEQV